MTESFASHDARASTESEFDGRAEKHLAPSPAPWWYALIVVVVSGLIELRYLPRGISLLDEGWAMYAAMQLHQGGTLYQDILWVFPPAHVFTAWIGYLIDPPGIHITRALYALWTVMLCLGCYQLGRRVMPSRFALLGALLLAFAAPRTHTMQLLFGYRYLVLAVLALLAFHVRLRRDDPRWMLVAGVLAGITVSFRLTPAFSVSVGIGFGVMLATRDWRRWISDWTLFGSGLLIVLIPLFAYFGQTVGVATFLREVVIHPLEMLQPLPVPELVMPQNWSRFQIESAFWRLEFRLYALLFAAYGVALAWSWIRCFRADRPFPHAFLASIVIFGAVFYIRSHGRADESHLDSTVPILCVLLAHATSIAFQRLRARPGFGWLRTSPAATATAFVVLAAWIFLLGSDRMLIHLMDGRAPIAGLADEVYVDRPDAKMMARLIQTIRQKSRPEDRILDLSPSPYFYVMSDRRGPGTRDVIMPGTFYDAEDERTFLATLEASPPRLVIWPHSVFDNMADRSVVAVAPLVVDWVKAHYRPVLRTRLYSILAHGGETP